MNIEIYDNLINFENDEWHITTTQSLDEEKKLIEVGFDYVRYSNKTK